MKTEILGAIAAIRSACALLEHYAEPPHMKGYRFEKDFLLMCRQRGLKTRKPEVPGHVDLLVNGLRVQCKYVTPNEQGNVCIQPGQRTWYEESDFDVLVMRCLQHIYIVPMSFLPKTNGHVRITIKPLSFRRFIDNWGVFDGQQPPPCSSSEFLFEDL